MLEDLGGESDGAPDVEVSVLGTVDEVGTDYRKFHQHFSPRFEEPSDGPIEKKKKKLTLLKRLDVLGGQGDPDLVDLLGTGASLFEVFLVLGHFCL